MGCTVAHPPHATGALTSNPPFGRVAGMIRRPAFFALVIAMGCGYVPPPTQPATSYGTIRVEVLRIHQSSRSWTGADIRVTNDSEHFVSFWTVGGSIYDSRGQYLGHEDWNGKNLRPRASVVVEVLFADVKASEVARSEWRLDKVRVEDSSGKWTDETRRFGFECVQD